MKIRTHNINVNFFDSFNERSVYVLGYLFADGSVHRGVDGKRNELVISGRHLGTLRQISAALGSDYPIIPRGNSFQIRISSRALVYRLQDLGLTPNKTQSLAFPTYLPERHIRHFIRGYFDGKGSFMKEAGRRTVISFSGGSYNFIEGLRDQLVLLGCTRAEIHHYGANNATNVIRYYIHDTRRIYNAMYHQATIYSQEQKVRYEQF